MIVLDRQVFLVGGHFNFGLVDGMLSYEGGMSVHGGGGGNVEGMAILCMFFTLGVVTFLEDILF